MEARGRVSTQQPQLEQEGAATIAAEHGPDSYLGMSMGGTSSVPFQATGTMQGENIPLGSVLMAEAAARDAAATGGSAVNFPAGYEGGSTRTSRQRAPLTTRPSARVHGLPQQRDGDGDDVPVLPIASDCQLTDSDWSDGDDDCDGVTSIERAARDSTQRKAPAAGIARGSKADCAQYVGVCFVEGKKGLPFTAQITFKSKQHHICYCPSAEAAARAYDAVACMIPGRKLNFPTTIPAVASSSRQREGASAVPAESDILAAVAAVRQAQPLARKGAVKYFGVHIDKKSARNPYKAGIWIDGKQKHLGYHPTAEAAARAYDALARTITGRKLNLPTGGSGAAAAAGAFARLHNRCLLVSRASHLSHRASRARMIMASPPQQP
jgi:hypothetical protein